ncbi:N-formylglutamate amidohydrolase (plasmid) [Rhodococcus opacus]|uniref:N-formylglutamate amidohydrolase n=1 Tax=Rhodococcus opacus TaxID=37919 RepID=UPI001FF25669|nr:N-formylglutamate amidohydrolase [Rhodococcus opacus]UOT08498.1 N-formylglutamate amidohydrolase [Rhodococcus opacus]
MSASSANYHPALPSLTSLVPSVEPHVFTMPARTDTNIELRIHTVLTSFDVAAGQWVPAASGFAVTVLVHSVDTATGRPRYLPVAEPDEWARAIFSDVDAAQGYFLGAVDPDTGKHQDGQLAYRLYLDTDRQAIRVPQQVVTCPQYLLRTGDAGPEIRIVTTA